jgi:RNA polymerase sigma-70 factor (ECF subfamily)
MSDFQQLYERHARDVHRFAVYLSGDAALADDITSETFTRVWTARDAVRIETARAYLLAIARNLYLDCLRRRRPVTPVDESLPDPAPGPQAEAEGRSELKAVLAALQRLPETDRSALLMRAQDGMPYSDIAAALGLSVAAVKVKVHRARLRLAEARQGQPSVHAEGSRDEDHT